jgi:hypothetical protein
MNVYILFRQVYDNKYIVDVFEDEALACDARRAMERAATDKRVQYRKDHPRTGSRTIQDVDAELAVCMPPILTIEKWRMRVR